MIVAFDTYYYGGFSYTVAGIFESWNSESAKYYVCNRRIGIDSEYVPGELYKRELPCIMQCLEKINVDNITSIIVDGFSWLVDEDGNKKPGLGKRLQDAIIAKYDHHISVIGIAKNQYGLDIPNCKEVFRGKSTKPLYVTCTEDQFLEHYASQVQSMFGEYRIPDIIKAIDTKTRSYCEEIENDTSTIDTIIRKNNESNKQPTLGDIAINMGDFDQFVNEAEERGFKVL